MQREQWAGASAQHNQKEAKKLRSRLKQSTAAAVARFLRANGLDLESTPPNDSIRKAIQVFRGSEVTHLGPKLTSLLIREFAKEIGAGTRQFQLKYPKSKPPERHTKEYLEYLQSPEWAEFRRTIFKERGAACEECRTRRGVLHLHHLTYEHLGHELPQDVKILCVACHKEAHGLMHSGKPMLPIRSRPQAGEILAGPGFHHEPERADDGRLPW